MVLVLFAFFYRISDPQFGGTYIAVFNSFYSLGLLISRKLGQYVVSTFTLKVCSHDSNNSCHEQKDVNVSDIRRLGVHLNCIFVNCNGF